MMINAAFLLLAVIAQPLTAAPAFADVFAGEESRKAASTLSIQVEPRLSDGRLVVKLAAQHKGGQPVPFGGSNLVLTGADGTRIAWRPLPALITDVEAAYGTRPAVEVSGATLGATATNSAAQRGVQPDVSNHLGSSSVARTEAIRSGSGTARRKKVSAADKAKAEAEVAQLKAAILQDRPLPAGEVAAGMLVSEKLKPGVAGNTVNLSVTIGPDQHSFIFKAPTAQ